MKNMNPRIIGLVVALLWAAGCAQLPTKPAAEPAALPPAEPRNLGELKTELIRYHDSGDYGKGLAHVASQAKAWIEQRVAQKKPDEKLAVVFDIDETALSNWANMSGDDFGYIPERWIAWAARAEAVAIEPVKAVYDAARAAGLDVFFLTGRREYQRSATDLNLMRQGYTPYTRLIMQPTGAEKLTAAEYKTAARSKLAEEGYVIIANIGDQESDLSGGFAEKTFKLPNPFYKTE